MVASSLGLPGDDKLLGVIFAGGASRRYGPDKALAKLSGAPLLQWVVDRMAPQVAMLAFSGLPRPGFSQPVIPDETPCAGPLAALRSILAWADQQGFSLVATVSCDTPFIPRDVVRALYAGLKDHDCCVASRGGTAHPTSALWKTATRARIEAAFEAGVRSLHGTMALLNAARADFIHAAGGPGGDPFFNINSPPDMIVAQDWLDKGGRG